jgi:hypothetical protein
MKVYDLFTHSEAGEKANMVMTTVVKTHGRY